MSAASGGGERDLSEDCPAPPDAEVIGVVGEQGAIDETVEPPTGGDWPLVSDHRERQESQTRTYLAIAMVVLLFIIVVTGCAGWLIHHPDASSMQAFGTYTASVVTLVAVVLTYYFATGRDK